MILDVPYISQIPLQPEEEEEKKWCGLACLAMVLGYYLKDKAPSAQELVERYGSWFESNGFAHKDLIKIARDYNLRGFRKSWWDSPGNQSVIDKFKQEGESEEDIKDWQQSNLEEGLFTIKQSLAKKEPVIVSVTSYFSPSSGTHLIVIIGHEGDQFILHDPFKKGANYPIKEDEFKKYWLSRAIFIKD